MTASSMLESTLHPVRRRVLASFAPGRRHTATGDRFCLGISSQNLAMVAAIIQIFMERGAQSRSYSRMASTRSDSQHYPGGILEDPVKEPPTMPSGQMSTGLFSRCQAMCGFSSSSARRCGGGASSKP